MAPRGFELIMDINRVRLVKKMIYGIREVLFCTEVIVIVFCGYMFYYKRL